MTLPRWIVPGAVVHVTRRCVQRQFLCTPSPEINQVFDYCIGRAAELFNIEVHAASIQSNHYHIVLTDHDGKLPQFMQWLNHHVGKCLIGLYADSHPERHLEAIWARESYGYTVLLTEEAVREAIVYTLTNPVKDGMVQNHKKWPGLSSHTGSWRPSALRTVNRPKVHFKTGLEVVTYQYTLPACLCDEPLEDTIDSFNRRIEKEERKVKREFALKGRSFMGVKAVLRQDPFGSPRSVQFKGKRTPVLAAGGDSETMSAAKDCLVNFRQQYREARDKFRTTAKGSRAKVMFPAGTYLLKCVYDVLCDCADHLADFALGRRELRDRPPLMASG